MTENTDGKGKETAVKKRDAHGRFLPGAPGGPGRPPAAKEERYYQLTREAVTENDWLAIVTTTIERAKKGDRWAREWLGNYLLGRPVQRVDASIVDQSLQILYVNDWRDDPD